MGAKTKIQYCDSTWSPVTGCLHGCEYCYARGIARRFGGAYSPTSKKNVKLDSPEVNDCWKQPTDIDEPRGYMTKKGKLISAPYPYGFIPTLHRYRLGVPQTWKTPRTIFVCDMADLFGDWVPDEWIQAVFEACAAAPQHTYLFLTKNPKRYIALAKNSKLPSGENLWYGSTATDNNADIFFSTSHNSVVSAEPLLGDGLNTRLDNLSCSQGGVIIGAMTGPGAKKHQPRREWVDDIVAAADDAGIPVFMKDSLAGIVGEENMRRELPWEVHK
jgi:protein gp37